MQMMTRRAITMVIRMLTIVMVIPIKVALMTMMTTVLVLMVGIVMMRPMMLSL